jgi:hypothetical protein
MTLYVIDFLNPIQYIWHIIETDRSAQTRPQTPRRGFLLIHIAWEGRRFAHGTTWTFRERSNLARHFLRSIGQCRLHHSVAEVGRTLSVRTIANTWVQHNYCKRFHEWAVASEATLSRNTAGSLERHRVKIVRSTYKNRKCTNRLADSWRNDLDDSNCLWNVIFWCYLFERHKMQEAMSQYRTAIMRYEPRIMARHLKHFQFPHLMVFQNFVTSFVRRSQGSGTSIAINRRSMHSSRLRHFVHIPCSRIHLKSLEFASCPSGYSGRTKIFRVVGLPHQKPGRIREVEKGPFEITLLCERYSCILNVIISLIFRNRTNSLCLRRRYFTNQKRNFLTDYFEGE